MKLIAIFNQARVAEMSDQIDCGQPVSVIEHLRILAELASLQASWIEPPARRPNDKGNPEQRTVTFEADQLDEFLNSFVCLSSTLEMIAEEIEEKSPELLQPRQG